MSASAMQGGHNYHIWQDKCKYDSLSF